MRSLLLQVPLRRHAFVAALLGGVALLSTAAMLSGCATTATVTSSAQPDDANPTQSRPAKAAEAPRIYSHDRDSIIALSGNAIRVLVWNVHKGSSAEWIGDFRTMSTDTDLVLLQEAHLHKEFADGLVGISRWDLVQAWRLHRAPTGVLTGSDAEPLSVRALEHREPLLRTEKSALITEYRIADSSKTLLVANVHAINFTIDTRAFRAQLTAVAELLDEHVGPVILSGDLNTWRDGRRAIVHEIADALQLTEVEFNGPRKQFRQYPLDHVFYRDLQVLSSSVTEVGSSDHNPLQVTFRMPGYVAPNILQQAAATVIP